MISIDATGVQRMFKELASKKTEKVLQAAVGRAGRLTEGSMRAQLWSLIYATPESPYYERTTRLLKGAHAAHPDKDHSSDDDRALKGDLSAKDDMKIVKTTDHIWETQVGDWVSYAIDVHEGLGQGARGPRPFTDQAFMDAETFLQTQVNSAIAAVIAFA